LSLASGNKLERGESRIAGSPSGHPVVSPSPQMAPVDLRSAALDEDYQERTTRLVSAKTVEPSTREELVTCPGWRAIEILRRAAHFSGPPHTHAVRGPVSWLTGRDTHRQKTTCHAAVCKFDPLSRTAKTVQETCYQGNSSSESRPRPHPDADQIRAVTEIQIR